MRGWRTLAAHEVSKEETEMLQINLSKVAYVIVRAREMSSEMPGTAFASELRGFISDLNVDEQASLVALMWIGRESFTPDELDEAIATARQEATAPTADYLLGIPMLADFLEDGLDALGLSVEEVEEEVLRS